MLLMRRQKQISG